MKKKTINAVVLAAGKGKRMRSSLPKVLHEVCGRSLLEISLRAVAGIEPEKVILVLGHGIEQVSQSLAEIRKKPFLSGIEIEVVEQKEQKGTGHAVGLALEGVSEDVDKILILPGDVPLLSADVLAELIDKSTAPVEALAFLTCDVPVAAGFGRVLRDEQGKPKGIVEHKDCSEKELEISEINSSIYLADRDFLARALKTLSPANSQGEYYLTDIVGFAVSENASLRAEKLEDYLSLTGANSRSELAALERIRREQLVEEFLAAGVSFEDPANVYLDQGVSIGRDSFIGAGVRLKGETSLAESVVIEGPSQVRNSSIGKSSQIKMSCYLDGAKVGDSCQIGPFAHLRPDSVLEENVKVGNFVETKKSSLAKGAKANHLSYIGDAEVGESANIGAGTITCNYDGYSKSKTFVGEKAFIGSNTSLVAPVVVGPGSVIGAGSVITKAVPPDALSLERAEQRTIENWAARKRKNRSK